MISPRRNLSRKLSLGIMLMAVPIFVLSLGLFFMQSRSLIHKKTSEHAYSILNTTMQSVVNYMGAVSTAARSNAWLLEEHFNPDSIQAITYRIMKRHRSIISCSVGTEPNMFPSIGHYFSVYTVNNGDSIMAVREPDYEYFNKMWYKKARMSDKGCWINPFSNYTEATIDHNDAVASYSMPLHASDGSIVGILATDFSFTQLANIFENIKLPYPNAYYVLLGGDGRYLIHPDENLVFKKTIFSENDAADHADLIALGHEMTAGNTGTLHTNIDGKYCHVSYGAVPDTDWSLALVIPSDEMMGPYHHLGYVIIGLIIIGLIIVQWLCYRVVHHTIEPITPLLTMTQRIAEGHYDEVIPRSDHNDAMAQLQNSFAAMQRAIMSKMGSIGQTASEIEKYNVQQVEKVQQAEEAIQQKNQFISHVLNQVRRPLDVIKGGANAMLNGRFGGLPDNELAAIADKMKYNAVSLDRMVLMLYDSSETEAADKSKYLAKKPVACNKEARECINFIHEQFPHTNMRLETEVPDQLQVNTNHLYLMLTLRELLYNAAKYSDGQHIVIRIKLLTGAVRFIVEDVGPGLPDDVSLDLVFKPFAKVDNLSEGLGLGLPLCKRHIDNIGGQFIHDKDYKGGCRFFVDIPLSA